MICRGEKLDSKRCFAVGCIEVGQSITDVGILFGIHYSVISGLLERSLISQTLV